jgi:hypothetical protein
MDYAKAIPKSKHTDNLYLTNNISMFMAHTDKYEIQRIIKQIKRKQSTGNDNIYTAFIKQN